MLGNTADLYKFDGKRCWSHENGKRRCKSADLQSWTLWHVFLSSGFRSTWHKLLTWSSLVKHCTERCMTPTPQVTEHCGTQDRDSCSISRVSGLQKKEQRQMVSPVSRNSSKDSNPAKCSNTGLILIKWVVVPLVINPFLIIIDYFKTTILCSAFAHFAGWGSWLKRTMCSSEIVYFSH